MVFSRAREGTGVGIQPRSHEFVLEINVPDSFVEGLSADVLKSYCVSVSDQKLVKI